MNEQDPNGNQVDPWARTIQEAFDLWINPEIERRRAKGVLPADFLLLVAQVIMNVGAKPEVRLNEEVKVAFKAPATRRIEKGEPITWDDVGEIAEVSLTTDDPNAGHLTLIRRGDQWLLAFDFRYNANRIGETITTASEFLDAARFSESRGHAHAFCENLFAAVELTAKARLMLLPDAALLSAKTHGYVAAQFNRWGKAGNVDPAHVGVLNDLANLRPAARYLRGDLSIDASRMREMLGSVEQMLEMVRHSIPRRVPVDAIMKGLTP